MRVKLFYKKITLIICCFLFVQLSISQIQKITEINAVQLLDNAIGKAIKNNKVAVYMQAMALELKQPEDIFTMPEKEILRGGFIFIDGKKFEMKIGSVKNVSDGNLLLIVDEPSKTLFIDSIRNPPLPDENASEEIKKMITETFTGGKITYDSREIINGHECYKIKSIFENSEKSLVYYWIDVQTEQLYLMAEFQNETYDVYWIKSVGEPPITHNYSLLLPLKKLDHYDDYKVFDNRFVRN